MGGEKRDREKKVMRREGERAEKQDRDRSKARKRLRERLSTSVCERVRE